jgi:photosystem II stability/assembly factor-like uncharacterized protein
MTKTMALLPICLVSLAFSLLAQGVTVTIEPYNPPISIPAGGGTFNYSVIVKNGEGVPVTFDLWTVADLPNGKQFGPAYGPVEFSLPEGWSAGRDGLTQDVPGFAPPGTYTYTVNAGTYPNQILGSDSFEFEKLAGIVGWYSQSPGTDVGLYGVSFVDQNTGWAVSRYREIIHTTDGGDTWQHQEDPQLYYWYEDVHFVDAENGWVVGSDPSGGKILHTTDGGSSWIEQEPHYGYGLSKVFFTDASNGWTVGGFYDEFGTYYGRVIEHTSNGGATWVGQLLQYYEHGFASIYFADVSNGWAVGPLGAILHTTNGGGTWTEENSGTTENLRDVYFVDPSVGWCVGEGGTTLHTADAGLHWQAQATGTSADIYAVTFADAATGWVAGFDFNAHPVILKTEDGGLSWQPQDSGMQGSYLALYDITFVDANQGWAAGTLIDGGYESGAMLHTENGGGE